MQRQKKTIIGWEEWCGFPDLGLPAVKAKIDTGAKTSALHAYDIEPFKKDGQDFVRFKVHPLQRDKTITRLCETPLIQRRAVTSSNGERERRYVILTPITFLNGITIEAEVTLTSRHKMAFRMLLGREALRKAKFVVDSSKALTLGRVKTPQELYLP